jgi:hypothetical protein
MKHRKTLYDRLSYAFGARNIEREVSRMLSRIDPLEILTPDAQQELFEALLRSYRRTKRMNAANRRIAAARKS